MQQVCTCYYSRHLSNKHTVLKLLRLNNILCLRYIQGFYKHELAAASGLDFSGIPTYLQLGKLGDHCPFWLQVMTLGPLRV